MARRTSAPATGSGETTRAPSSFWAVVAVLVAGQLALRGWALGRSYFFSDDFLLLQQAGELRGWRGLLDPFNSHLMPAGRLVVELVAASGELRWGTAVAVSMALQLLASAACAWMLVTLFGPTWRVLPLLCLYLFGAMTLPALMWWAASLTQLAMQPAFFAAVALWVRHLRGQGRLQWLGALVAVALGVAFDVKAVLVVPVLAYVALAWFAEGGPWRRFRSVVVCQRAAVLTVGVALAAYAACYTTQVEQPFGPTDPGLLAGLSGTMVGTSVASTAVGGPWHWAAVDPPNADVDPGQALLTVAWVVLVLLVLGTVLRRRRTLRAWALLAGYLAVLVLLVYSARLTAYGSDLGLQLRFVTDAACVLVLCVGLACLPLRGSLQPSEPRAEPYLTLGLRPWGVAALSTWLVVSGTASSVAYARIWHDQNAGGDYVRTLAASVRQAGVVDLADTAVPDDVVPSLSPPYNRLSRLLRLVDDDVRFPTVTDQLHTVDATGHVTLALLDPATESQDPPPGPCGWTVQERGVDIPLRSRAFDYSWWVRIGYLSSADSRAVVTIGDQRFPTDVSRGLNSLFVEVTGSFDEVSVDGLDDGVTVCVDRVEVGQPVAAEAS